MKSEKDSLLLIFHKHSDTIIIRKHYFAESYSLLGIQEVDNCSKKNVAQFTEVTTSSWRGAKSLVLVYYCDDGSECRSNYPEQLHEPHF